MAQPAAAPPPLHDTPGLASRRAAVRLLLGVLKERQPFDECFEASAASGSLAQLSVRDRSLARAIATTALRRLGEIEHRLGQLISKPLPRKSGALREILLAASAQILFMRVPARAAVDTAVRLVRADREAHHFTGLANAVLRRIATIEVHGDPARLNTPDWLWRRWLAAYGEDTARAITRAHIEDPPLDVTPRSDAANWAVRLGGSVLPTSSIRMAHPGQRVDDLPGYAEGTWWVQDAAAALPARLLGDVSGLRVLDLCAAPGGKTAQLAAAGAAVVAVDRSEVRLARLRQNLARLRLDAEIVRADALEFNRDARYDAVLLDAPCTSTGAIRRNPDVPHLKSEDQVVAMAGLQRRLLDHAADLVKTGGLLVYCTCSLEPEEGELQVASFLDRNPAFSRIPVRPHQVGDQIHLVNRNGDLRTLPCDALGSFRGLDGFYAARLRRL